MLTESILGGWETKQKIYQVALLQGQTERIDKLESLLTDMTEAFSSNSPTRDNNRKKLCDASTQTVSTGDISITKVYSESNKNP